MHRTWAEKRVEQRLRARWIEETAQLQRKARRRRGAERAEAFAPGPRKRAVTGEFVEDAMKAIATVWRKGGQ